MEKEEDDLRRELTGWRDYLKEIRESIRVYGWVWREFVSDKSRRWTRRALVSLSLAVIVGAIQPWVVSRVFNGLQAHDGRAVVIGVASIFVCVILNELCQWRYSHWREHVLGENMGRLDQRSSELFFGKSLGQHMRESGALNAANVEKGRNRVLEVEGMLMFEGVPAILEIMAAFVFLWFLSPVAGAIAAALFVQYLAWLLYLNRRVVTVCSPIDLEFRRLNRHRVERWDNVERVKACGKEEEEVRAMGGWFERVLADDRRFWLWFIRVIHLRGVLTAVFVLAILSYGAWKVWHGAWSLGLLYPLYQWAMRIGDNVWRIGHIEHRLNWNMPSVRSMMEALTVPPDIQDAPDAVDLPADSPLRVEIAGLTYDYGETPKPGEAKRLAVLRGAGFTIEPGEKVALIGASGAGKTTVMRLLQRNIDPRGGAITIDGLDLRRIRLNSWLRLIGYIPQQAQVLDGTLRYNLTYGLSEAERARVKDEDLWELLRMLKLSGDRFAQGLDTLVGRRGIKLSGGEAQRVMIGAAAVRRPRVMIIDEATSSLDSTTEKAVQKGLTDVLADRSMSALIIAHRLSTVRGLCAKFVVLRSAESLADGEPQVEAVAGSFEELYAISPTFRRLADDQGLVIAPPARESP